VNHEFEEIYRKYQNRVYMFLLKMCKNTDLAEELTQETFYQAFCSFHRYDGSCHIFTWLAAVGKNTFFKYLRKNKNQAADLELFVDIITAPGDDEPESVSQKSFVNAGVRKAISELPQKYRDVVILRIYGELAFSEIGANLGITENSAKVIFFRAKNTIKEQLQNENIM